MGVVYQARDGRWFLILDPTKVMRIALQNAASIAGLLITTEGLEAELPEEEKAPKYPTPPGGDMY